MIKVSVDAECCTGHGRCYDLAPAVFAADDYGHAVVIKSDLSDPAEIEQALLAGSACPERAVRVEG